MLINNLKYTYYTFRRKDGILSDTLNNTDDTATPMSSKKIKASLPASNSIENSAHQNSPSFHQLANNTLLQKSIYFNYLFSCLMYYIKRRYYILKCVYLKNLLNI